MQSSLRKVNKYICGVAPGPIQSWSGRSVVLPQKGVSPFPPQYAELKKTNPNKATGPDGVPAKLVKEFAYELSVPLNDILNCS